MLLTLVIAIAVGLIAGLFAARRQCGIVTIFACMFVFFAVSLALSGIPSIGLLASPGGMLILAIVWLVYLGVSVVAVRLRAESSL